MYIALVRPSFCDAFSWLLIKKRFKNALKSSQYRLPKIQREPYISFTINELIKLKHAHPHNFLLHNEIDKEIHHLKNGWNLGFWNPEDLPMNDRPIAMNRYTLKAKLAIGINLCEEIEAGRILPYDQQPDNIIPLIAIDKKTGGELTWRTKKVRVCRHGSSAAPGTYSMNDLTPEEEYKVVLPRTKDFCAMILAVGRYAWLFKTDLKDAFRQLGIRPDLWRYNGYQFLKRSLIDTRDIYGTRSGSKHTQEFGEMIIKAFKNWIAPQLNEGETIRVLNYIDDHAGAIATNDKDSKTRPQWILERFYEFIEKCGLEESLHKRTGLHQILEICGLVYNTINLTVSPSPTKMDKVKFGLTKIVVNKCCMAKQFESILGSLNWFAQLIWPGVAFMRRLRMKSTAWKAENGETDGLLFFNDVELKDIYWWLDYMDLICERKMIDLVTKVPHQQMIPLWTDGATNGSKEKTWSPGMGAYFNGNWSMTPVPPEYHNKYNCKALNYEKEIAIVHFEALAVVSALHTYRDSFKEGDWIKLYCDNTGCCSVFERKNSNDLLLMDCVRWIVMFAMKKRIGFYIQYIRTTHNKLADPLSRFDPKKFMANCNDKHLPYNSYNTPLKIPDLDVW